MTVVSRRGVLVVAAHPDDEVLGCAGTLVRHTRSGDQVHIAFLTDGVSSEDERRQGARQKSCAGEGAQAKQPKIIGANPPHFSELSGSAARLVPLIEIVQSIERLAAPLQPETIYSDSVDDLNSIIGWRVRRF